MDTSGVAERIAREAGKPQDLSTTGADKQADLAPGIDRLHLEYGHVHDELLDAKAGEITVRRILQQFDRTSGDDSASCGPAGGGDGVAEFRSPARTEISCGDSRHRRWNRPGVAGRNSFPFSNATSSVLRRSRPLQRLRPVLLGSR